MFFWYGMCVRSRYTTMENLEVIAQQILWQIGLLYPCSQLWVSEAVTTLCKLTRIDSVCKYLHKYICSIICLLLLIFYVFELSPFYCILTMQNLVVLAWKMTVMFSLVYTHKCHAPWVTHPFWICFANFCRGSIWATMQNLEVLAWKMTELCQF